MKRAIIIFAISIGLFAGCSIVEEDNKLPISGDVVFFAHNGEAYESKTVLQSDGSIKWKPADKINLFYDNYSFLFTSSNKEDATEVEFHGSLDGIEYTQNGEFWAVYPYGEGNVFDDESVTVALPSVQTAITGSFDDDLYISIAKTKDRDLTFYNVCGGIRFSVVQEGVKKVVFKGANNEIIAGTAKVAFNAEGKPFVKEVVSGSSEIVVVAPKATTFEIGKWYYIVCYPCVLTSGYVLRMVKQDDTIAEKIGNKTVSIKRSIWGALDESDENLSYEIPHNEIWYTTINDGTLYPTERDGWGRNIISNAIENGKGVLRFDGPITAIPDNAYSYNSTSGGYLKTISLPNSVTSIGEKAFYQCNNLEAIQMSDNLTTISNYAFYRCGNLKSIVIPEKVISIGLNVFTDCYNMEDVSILSTSKNFGDTRGYGYLFMNNAPYISNLYGPNATSDGRFIIIDNVVVLAAGKGQHSITIPNNVTEIGQYVFSRCNQLQTISLPTSLLKIGEGCFSYCTLINDIQLPSGLTEIKSGAFQNCTSLQSVNIPIGVQEIASYTFENCTSLSSIQYGESIKKIYAAALKGCTNLTQITIPRYLEYLATDALPNTISSIEVLSSAIDFSSSSGNRYASCFPRSSITEITGPYARENNSMLIINGSLLLATITGRESAFIPEDVCCISESVFSGASTLKKVIIPSEVTEIQDGAFRNCSSLEKVVLRSIIPPTITSSSFFNSGMGLSNGSTYPFYVPVSSVNSYKNADIWNDYESRIYANELSNEPGAIDLGLSVKWASCNLGASEPEESGLRYAWGETEKKANYSWSTYRWGTMTFLKRYVYKIYPGDSGKVDNNLVLDRSDDAANVNLSGYWRMPTVSEYQELLSQCTWSEETLYGVSGWMITSKKNGAKLFLPFVSVMRETTLTDHPQYWTSNLTTDYWSTSAECLLMKQATDQRPAINNTDRCYGLPIRPVYSQSNQYNE